MESSPNTLVPEEFMGILDKYTYSTQTPVEDWDTADIVRLIELLDSELQERAALDASTGGNDEHAYGDEEVDDVDY